MEVGDRSYRVWKKEVEHSESKDLYQHADFRRIGATIGTMIGRV